MKKTNIKNTMKKVKKTVWTLYAICVCASMGFVTACAEGEGGGGTGVWNNVINTLLPYIIALGGVVAFIGGVNWALGFKSEDSDAQTRGLRTLIAGAAVAGLATAAKTGGWLTIS